MARTSVSLVVLLLLLWFLVGCATPERLMPPAVEQAVEQSLGRAVVRADWSLGEEVKRSGDVLISAYDGLDDDDDARVPEAALPAARAARVAVLMTTCRLVLEVTSVEERRMSQQIAAHLWEGIEREKLRRDAEKAEAERWRPRADGVIDIVH